jgi:hypothetical protein
LKKKASSGEVPVADTEKEEIGNEEQCNDNYDEPEKEPVEIQI